MGIRQAERARELLLEVELEKVYASPLERARHTAEIAGDGRPVETDERLIEVDFGNWEGKTRAEFVRESPVLWDDWCTDPGSTRAGGTGETALEVVQRVDDFFSSALKLHATNILVVGHNGINRLYMSWKLGMHLKDYRRIVQENSAVTLFSLDEENGFTLKLLNSH